MLKKSDAIVRIISSNVEADIFSPYKIKSDNESIGTGFFINSDGYILTCAHVVDSSIKISISVPPQGKKKIDVVVHSICYDKDFAILKTIDYKNNEFCILGDSNALKSEDSVTAVGYPLGQDRLKKTRGIISGIQDRYIQTDTPINPGNSGGPLFNSKLEVVGINTSKIMSMFAENIGFATPINDFLLFQSKMFNPPENKIIVEPKIYCEIQNTTQNHCRLFKCPQEPGVIIKNLVEKSPLYNAGVRENDILLYFDKYKLDGNGDADAEWSGDKVHFYDLLAKYTQDSLIEITYWSLVNQKIKNAKIKFDNDNLYKIKYVRCPFENLDYEIFAGMLVMELTMNHIKHISDTEYSPSVISSLQKYSTVKKRTSSVIFISMILQGSYVSTLNEIHAGTIIKNVNGKCVDSLENFRNAVRNGSLHIDGHYLIYLKLKDKNQIILDMNDLYKEEQILSDRYKYKISNLYNFAKQQ